MTEEFTWNPLEIHTGAFVLMVSCWPKLWQEKGVYFYIAIKIRRLYRVLRHFPLGLDRCVPQLVGK